MYLVFKGTRPAGKKRFSTYEEARRYARSLVRRFVGGISRATTTNPPIGAFGYSVRKVA